MNLPKRCPFILLILIFFWSNVYGQVTGSGKEFWVGFMDNLRVPPSTQFPGGLIDRAILEIVAVEQAKGEIIFKGQEITFDLAAGQNFTYVFPESAAIISRKNGEVESNGVQVKSDGNVMVYAYNQREKSMDATSILPIQELLDDYWVMAHSFRMDAEATFDGDTESAASFLIIAIDDNTTVEITPRSRTLDGKQANVSFNVVLNAGQTYQVKSKNILTSSNVRVIQEGDTCNKRIAVFAGNRWVNNGGAGPDNSHMYAQMLGNKHISKDFIHVGRETSGFDIIETIDFFSPDLEGFVSVNGIIGLNPLGLGGLGHLIRSSPNLITMTNAGFAMVKLASLSASGNLLPTSGLGDPAMTYLMGIDQMISISVFSVRSIPTIQQHLLLIVVKESSKDLTLLNGISIGSEFQSHPTIPGYAFTRKILNPGQFILENQEGFNAYQHGAGFNESYALTLFQADKSPDFQVQSSYEFEVIGEKVACLLQEGNWTIESGDPSFLNFLWNFGDNLEIKKGTEVTHTYIEPGVYEVEIEARRTDDLCEIPELINFEVEVIDNSGEITGPDRVCPNVDVFPYFFVPNGEIDFVEWEIVGGEKIEELADFGIMVLWGTSNENAAVKAIAYTKEGCSSEEIFLAVIVRMQLEPGPPIGPDISCLTLDESTSYEVAEVLDNRGYRWFAENGELSGANNLPVVLINWNPNETEGKIWYEEFSLNDEFCAGISESLEVTLVDELVISIFETSPVFCFGDATGFIELEVIGGTGNYTFEWSHNPTINSPKVENLPPGTYSVKVTDESGCEGFIDEIEITEPAILEIDGAVVIKNTSCFGKNDGKAIIYPLGGQAPYSISENGYEFVNGALILDNLIAGDYQIRVLDANGCGVFVQFEISSPKPLEIDIIVENKSCPGGTEGVLVAIPRGGNGPYSFEWKGLGQFSANAEGLQAGYYEVQVMDSNGCIGFGKITLQDGEPALRMPTGFYPNREIEFSPVSNCNVDFAMLIYNRWGQLIYYGNSGWDGNFDGQEAETGTYSYRVDYSYSLEETIQKKNQIGSFILIR
jgi:hypothetical protein